MKYLLPFIVLSALVFSCSKKQEKDAPANFEIKAEEEASLNFLVELVKDNPRNPRNYIRLAKIYFDNGDFDKATSILESAYEVMPENKRIQEMLMRVYWKNNELEKSGALVDDFDVERDKLSPFTKALINYQNNYFTNALEMANQAINLDQGNADLFKMKALILCKLGDSVAAVNAYDKAIKKENASLDMVIEYLRLLDDMGRMEDFGTVYQQLLPHQKKDVEVKLVFVDALISLNQLDSAKVILAEIDEEQFLATKYKQLAEINFDQRNYDSAIYYSDKSFDLDPEPETKLISARAMDRRWRYNDAVETYEQILEIDSTYTIAEEELEKLRRKIRYLRDLKRKEEMKIEILPSKSVTPKNLE